MKQNILTILFFISTFGLKAQEYKIRENISKDSLLNVSIKMFPEEIREKYIKAYKEGNESSKDFLLLMISLPKSSKKELIENYESKKEEILKLKNEYQKIVPKNLIIDIEFEPESKIFTIPEQISIKVYKVDNQEKNTEKNKRQSNNGLKAVSQNWNLKPGAKELQKVLKSIGWTNEELNQIKQLLLNANCTSIENGTTTTIGFSRSGMGKYFYKFFEEPLNEIQKQEYNNGCQYIYYKENVVLEYGGGAIGPQCFEKE